MNDDKHRQPRQLNPAQPIEAPPSLKPESNAPSKKKLPAPAVAAICIGAVVVLAAFAWTFLVCHHAEWEDAACTSPKTCVKCGKTEGEPLSHEWKDATCTEPKTCETCGATEGEALGHDFGEWSEDADIDIVNEVMLDSRKCSKCGKSEQAEGRKLTSFVENGQFIFSPWGVNKRFENKLGITSECDDGDVLSFAYVEGSDVIAMLSFTSMDGQRNLGGEYKFDSSCNPSPTLLINTEQSKHNMADISTAFIMSCDPSLDYGQAFSVVKELADNITGYSSSTTHNGIEYLLAGRGNVTLLRAVIA